jgi:hypothetical protein
VLDCCQGVMCPALHWVGAEDANHLWWKCMAVYSTGDEAAGRPTDLYHCPQSLPAQCCLAAGRSLQAKRLPSRTWTPHCRATPEGVVGSSYPRVRLLLQYTCARDSSAQTQLALECPGSMLPLASSPHRNAPPSGDNIRKRWRSSLQTPAGGIQHLAHSDSLVPLVQASVLGGSGPQSAPVDLAHLSATG